MIYVFDTLKVLASEIPALESGALFEFGSNHINALVANAGSLIDSFMPVMLVLAGLSLGMAIVIAVISIFEHKESRRRSERIDKILSETKELTK